MSESRSSLRRKAVQRGRRLANVIQVPDVPGPTGVCWKQAATMERCMFRRGHTGAHQWAKVRIGRRG